MPTPPSFASPLRPVNVDRRTLPALRQPKGALRRLIPSLVAAVVVGFATLATTPSAFADDPAPAADGKTPSAAPAATPATTATAASDTPPAPFFPLPAPDSPAAVGIAPLELLTADRLRESLILGRRFILNNQTPIGNFNYQYNFVTRTDSGDDNAIRQAGALWSLGRFHAFMPTDESCRAFELGMLFWYRRSRPHAPSGGLYPNYDPTSRVDETGDTGVVALLVLALVDALQDRVTIDDATRTAYERALDGYLNFLLSLQRADGLFASSYVYADGSGVSQPSPYYDGETLLALARVARLRNRQDLIPRIERTAEAMYGAYVTRALAADPDSEMTKGFFQWGCMAFQEIHAFPGELANRRRYATWTVELAYWMVDAHRILERSRNTAYAFEGLVPACDLARQYGDTATVAKLTPIIDRGLYNLTTWQIGNNVQNEFILAHPTDDDRAVGGVLNAADDPELRIDVTQHQMNALLLALQLLYRTR